MIEEVYPPFDKKDYMDGLLSPVFFGSAVNNFGVREMLDCFVDIAPTPLSTDDRGTGSHTDGKRFYGLCF